ncbi:MAG: DNA recombination protein RmuC, partial [Gammaproteobacteria bacterium]
MAEMSVAALFAALFFATTAVAAGYVFKLVRGRASAEAEHYSKLIEIQDAHQTSREALIVKESEVEALVRENQGIAARLQDVETEIKAERASNSLLQQELATLKTKLSEQATHHQEKLALLEEARSNLTLSFKQLAQEIFEAKQANFRDQSKEQLDGLLKPLNDRLKDFQARVETAYSEESRERFSLRNELKSLREMNTKISEDALNLTKALKGESKTQGTWGEVVLERVLEKSGLTKGREYDTQMSL